MTSLDFLKNNRYSNNVLRDWGTGGKTSKEDDLKIARAPTWHGEGTLQNQKYNLTQLKLCKNRMTDELIPKDIRINDFFAPKSATAEHPFSSHISKFEMFPSYNIQKEEPPKHEIFAVKKIKGNPYRTEMVINKFGNTNESDAALKELRRGRSKIYPIPRTIFGSDNYVTKNDDEINISQMNSEKVLKNIENNLMKSSYTISFDDKFEHKQYKNRHLSKSLPQVRSLKKLYTNDEKVYTPKMTFTEKEEFRLFNGTTYANLPKKVSFESNDYAASEEISKESSSRTDGMNSKLLSGPPKIVISRDQGLLLRREPSYLTAIQNSFTKSDAHKSHHKDFPWMHHDLRENVSSGRKHTFGKMNAQVMRGALLVV